MRKFAVLFQNVNTKKDFAILAVSLWNKLSFTTAKHKSRGFLKIRSKICNEYKVLKTLKILINLKWTHKCLPRDLSKKKFLDS